MSEKLMNSVVSALVGGVVGAAVVFFVGSKAKFDSLEVANLKITQSAVLVNAEGKEDVVIKDGSVLVNNVVLCKKLIGTQFQTHVLVANRVFTSPDDLVMTPMDQWKFYTEMGCTNEKGGELIVRSANGASVVGKEIQTGAHLRAGFNENGGPQLYAKGNMPDGVTLPVPFLQQQPRPATTEGAAPEGQAPETADTSAPPATQTIATNPDAEPTR